MSAKCLKFLALDSRSYYLPVVHPNIFDTHTSSGRLRFHVHVGGLGARRHILKIMSQSQNASKDRAQSSRVETPIDELKKLVLKCVATQGHSQTDSEIITEVCAPLGPTSLVSALHMSLS